MKYCMQCGTLLHIKEHPTEGPTPYCDCCEAYRYPVFNTAVSMIVTNPDQSRVILIRQYGKPFYVLVAGYVNKGEDAEDAAVREVMEEIGLTVHRVHFNRSHYFKPSNTLMLNFTAVVKGDSPHPNREIDSYAWFSPEEAGKNVRTPSLAGDFVQGYLTGHYEFTPY